MNVRNIDEELTTLAGAKIMLTANKALTYRTALVSACETFQGDPGDGNMLKAYDLGMKIMNAKDELKFEKEDVEFLKKVVETNRSFMAVIVGRLLDFINK